MVRAAGIAVSTQVTANIRVKKGSISERRTFTAKEDMTTVAANASEPSSLPLHDIYWNASSPPFEHSGSTR